MENSPEDSVSILVIDLVAPTDIKQQNLQQLISMDFLQPLDFVFDCANVKLALALDFESHPILVEALERLPHSQSPRMVGGRFGRTDAGQLATSEWSGRCNENWNDNTRTCFVQSMKCFGISIVHRPWHDGQTADEVG
ncbi:MAG: polymorphic toxin type 43 domain-containing protein [Cyanobacteria bacterium P01_F01_bin.150]